MTITEFANVKRGDILTIPEGDIDVVAIVPLVGEDDPKTGRQEYLVTVVDIQSDRQATFLTHTKRGQRILNNIAMKQTVL